MSGSVEKSKYWFIDGAGVAPLRIKSVEGVPEEGVLILKPLIAGENMIMLQVFREKGQTDPSHKHTDHESVTYLLKGKLKLTIGGQEFIATPGCTWMHPVNVEHSSVALEDSLQVEAKSPPRNTWQE